MDVAHSPLKEIELYQKAADQGNYRAQYNLGICYAKGEGVNRDLVQAYFWLFLAASEAAEMVDARDKVKRFLSVKQLRAAEVLIKNFVDKKKELK